MTARTRWSVLGALLALAAVVVATVGTGLGGSRTNAAAPIVIGWAYDSKGNMAPFDNPALAAARIRVNQVNARGGVNGRPLRIDTCDTTNNNPAIVPANAASMNASVWARVVVEAQNGPGPVSLAWLMTM